VLPLPRPLGRKVVGSFARPDHEDRIGGVVEHELRAGVQRQQRSRGLYRDACLERQQTNNPNDRFYPVVTLCALQDAFFEPEDFKWL